jgi:hypothetical protein
MEKIGDDATHPSVCSTTRCGANLAQGKDCLGAFRVPVKACALRQIRATSSREKGGSVTELDLPWPAVASGRRRLRVSVPPW